MDIKQADKIVNLLFMCGQNESIVKMKSFEKEENHSELLEQCSTVHRDKSVWYNNVPT